MLVEGTFLWTFDRRPRWRLHSAYAMIATFANKFATQLWDRVTSPSSVMNRHTISPTPA
jgi:hypothetical protein